MEEVDKWRTIESLIAGLSEMAREVKELEAAETDTDEHTSDEKCKAAGLPPTVSEAHYNAVMKARNAQANKKQEQRPAGLLGPRNKSTYKNAGGETVVKQTNPRPNKVQELLDKEPEMLEEM